MWPHLKYFIKIPLTYIWSNKCRECQHLKSMERHFAYEIETKCFTDFSPENKTNVYDSKTRMFYASVGSRDGA